jgi:hypothetical protein
MGAWGTGLYSGDFAMDLRSMIRAVARLPFPADRLVDVLCDAEPGPARGGDDPDHTVFWLVLADQFWKRGIESPRACDAALSIIDKGRDHAVMAALGMDASGLRRRDQMLAELRSRLVSAPSSKPRTTLKQPQPYLLETGDCYVYPTSAGAPINPYFASTERTPRWQQDGWGIIAVVERVRAFDFLAWYRLLTLHPPAAEKPPDVPMEPERLWLLRQPSTLTAVHAKRLRLEKLGSVPIDAERLWTVFPRLPPGIVPAVNDISIVGSMGVGPRLLPQIIAPPGEAHDPRYRAKYWSLLGLNTILAQ